METLGVRKLSNLDGLTHQYILLYYLLVEMYVYPILSDMKLYMLVRPHMNINRPPVKANTLSVASLLNKSQSMCPPL